MILYFFGLVPIVYFLNHYLGVNLKEVVVGLMAIIVILVDVFFVLKTIKWNKVLIIVLILFGLIHVIFYQFYGTMPESDGYADLLRIESMTKGGIVDYNYRPFFYTAMTILALTTKLNPYVIFTVWMIVLSVNVILVLNLIVDELKIKGLKRSLILLSPFAFPVLNLEIDFFRPQNIYLIFFPVWFYFLYKKKYCLSGLLALIGLGYHQFFIFPLIAFLGVVVWKYLPKWLIGVGVVMTFCFGIWKYWGMFKWRWWFLDNYSTYPDNVQMGWPGVKGAVMFYGYYYGPMFLTVILLFFKKIKNLTEWTLLMLLTMFLFISEILPRILFPYLPERFAVLSDLVAVFSLALVVKDRKLNKLHICLWAVLIIAGIGSSFYVAKNKGSLTSRNEVEAAEWIRQNTPERAIFFTQKSNETMMDYFARRKWMMLDKLDRDTKDGYILYSKDKLTGLYSTRQYWCERNYCGLDLNEISKNYELVYDKKGVLIWRLGN